MECEYCNKDHDGSFGSGRFCSKKCARGFSTKNKRKQINENVSKKMKGRKLTHLKEHQFKTGMDDRRKSLTELDIQKSIEIRKDNRRKLYESMTWIELPLAEKRRRILSEQKNKCECGINTWNGQPLPLELHHKDGNNKNDDRANLIYLCPNCHTQTDTFKNKKRN